MPKAISRKRRTAQMLRDDLRVRGLAPQARTVLKHLSDTGTITQREAMIDYSVQHLPSRIRDLRDAGFKINGVWKFHPMTGQRYMRYSFNG